LGRIKELQAKKEAGELSETEAKELKELLVEAQETEVEAKENDTADVDKEIENVANEIVSKAESKLESKIDSLVKALEKNNTPDVQITSSPRFVVDKALGEVPVQKLDDIKVAVPGRENKKHKEVTLKTLHVIEALSRGNVEKLQVLVEGTAALGGNLVPEEWANMIVEDRRDAVVMRQLATVIPVTTDTFHLPYLDTRPNVAWRSEAAVKATSTVQWGEITLTPYSLAGIVPLSNELVADASVGGSIVANVTRLLVRAIAETEDEAFWTGNGTGQPTGIDNYTFTTISGGLTDTTRADAVFNAYHRLPQGYRQSSAWAFNARTLGRIRTLKDSNNQYLLQGIGVTPQPVLLGRPVYEVNSLGDGKGFLGDFSEYHIADREGIAVDTSNEATVGGTSAFENNLTFIRVEERVDGELPTTRGIVELSSMGAI
jgi:HK97 family phage major capsid protein